SHYYNAKHQKLLDLGLEPHFLAETLIEDVIQTVERYRHRVRVETIEPRVDWRQGALVGLRPRRATGRSQPARSPLG
ncbi:MAG TPA: hypothetical protein VFD01_08280, partial [Candidatus Dormibacteraeota bacterium]|nr:hypothetical protein [Candidatus Dormibacteraeota bacterium]